MLIGIGKKYSAVHKFFDGQTWDVKRLRCSEDDSENMAPAASQYTIRDRIFFLLFELVISKMNKFC